MGRASKMGAAAAKPTPSTTQAPDAIALFGKPKVIVFKKEDGGKGVSMESMQPKPIEAGYIEPGLRSNPGYLKKLADEKAAQVPAQRNKATQAFGYGQAAKVIGASPNSPQAKAQMVY